METAITLDEIKVGDIFYHSWGYDQTNIDFYEVVKRMKSSVVIRMIQQEQVSQEGFMSAYVMPKKGVFSERNTELLTKRLKLSYRNAPYLHMEYGWCQLWDGQKKNATYYA